MNVSQEIIEALSPTLKKFLDRVLKGAIGKQVKAEVTEDDEIIITGDKESVMKARRLMEKVKGLRLDRMDTTPDGDMQVVFVEIEK